MNKKLFKQTIAVFMVCALLIGTIRTNTAFASTSDSNDKIITASSEKTDNNIVKNISSEENSTELNKILEECKEVNTDNSSIELRRGEMASVSEQVSSVSVYHDTTMAIMENGDLYCWGYNDCGQVGNGTTEIQTSPVKVLSNVSSVSVSGYDSDFSYDFVTAITKNGDLYCWGANNDGQVGNGTIETQTSPVKVLSNVSSVSGSGSGSVAAITKNDDLYCWGANNDGQVGNGTTETQTSPVKVLSDVSSVSGYGYGHGHGSGYNYGSVATITKNGDLYCWGRNNCGQVGNGTTQDQTTPVKVLSDVSSVSGYSSDYGYSSVAAITKSGDLYCWGHNYSGQVGNGTTETQTSPVKVLSDVSSVSVSGSGAAYSSNSDYDYSYGYGYGSVAAITKSGDLYCWGNNNDGQVGNGNTQTQTIPVKVLNDINSVSVYSFNGYGFVAAITKSGDLYCWGNNNDGQVGNGTTTQNQTTPVKVLSDVSSVSVSGSGYVSVSVAAITKNGDLYCWGNNYHGQVGNGNTETQTSPVKVLPIELPEPEPEISNINNAEIVIDVYEYGSFSEVKGAKVEIEGIGEAYTGEDGKAHITNSLNIPSDMKRITVSKEGYRDYIMYTTIVSSELVSVFTPNEIGVAINKKKADDDINPYISSFVYYRNYDAAIAKTCGGQGFEKSDIVTFRACGVWNDKKPSYYCMYQEGGKSFKSEDGIFKLEIGKSFAGKSKIYIKMVAEDGTESESEWVYITVPDKGFATDINDTYIPILNETAESSWQTDVPFLNNDKLSFDIGKLKTTIKKEGSKIRIMLGKEGSKEIFTDKEWEEWKKFCQSQPIDLSLSQWANVLNSDNLDTSWTTTAKLEATGYGWLENDLSQDSTTPLTGGIQVVIDLSTTLKHQYIVGVIPVYVESEFGVNGELEGSVTFDINEKKFVGNNFIKITPSLSIGGGVGILYVATVGAKGSASMPIEFNIPKGLTKADLEGVLSLEAKVLGFEYTKEMAKATYPLFPSNTAKTNTRKIPLLGQNKDGVNGELFNESLYDMNSYSLPNKTITESVWYGEDSLKNNLKKASKASSNFTETLLQTGTSPLTEPILVQEGDTTIAVFLTEDSNRSVIHRSKLVYTVYNKNDGTWSNPMAVCEDATGDFNPYISAANGKIAVSWLNYDSSVTDSSSMKEALQSSKICYAIWNADIKSFDKAENVISSSEGVSYNGAHPYIDANSNVTQVGIKNNAVDIFGMSGDNILFMTGICKNNRIDKEFILSQGIPVSYDIVESEGIITAAVCIDTDKDMTTLNDREVYTFSSDGTIKRLTENDTYDSAPQYAKYNGKDALYWYTEEGYKIFDVSEEKIATLEEKNMSISENFTVVNGNNNETAVVWSGTDKNSVYQLVASLLDKESGKWSSQVILSGSEEDIFRPSGYFNTDGEMEFIYRKGNTIDAGSLYALQIKQAPDLQLVDAYIKDGTEVAGETTKVFTGIRNLGTDKITKYRISVDGQVTEGTTELLPGESTLLEAEYKVPDTVQYGKIPIEITVEGDSNTTNNTFQLTTGYSDISVVATEDELNNCRIVHVAVENREAVSTDAVLEVHKNTKDGELISSIELGTLKQGDILVADFTYKKFPTGYDTDADALYYVVTSSVAEKYDSNNYDYTVFLEGLESNQGSDTTTQPTESPVISPSVAPSITPTKSPVVSPSTVPSTMPTRTPSASPSSKPSGGNVSIGGGTVSGGGGATIYTATPIPSPSQTPVPVKTPTPVVTSEPTIIPTIKPEASAVPSAMPMPEPSATTDTETDNKTDSETNIKKGLKFTDKKTKAVYKVISTEKNKSVEYVKNTKKNIKSVVIPATVKFKGKTFKVLSIGKAAFKDNKKLKSVKIGKNVKTIGKEAFSGCKKLNNVKMGKNITSIKASAFNKCTSLIKITIPAKVKKIGKKAFYKCKNLQYILVKTKKLKANNIGEDAFSSGYANPRVKSDKTVWKQYQNIFISKGLSEKALFIINPVKLKV